MKKIFVLAVFLVVIGVLCTLFFLRGSDETENASDEKPWTVGEHTSRPPVTETTEPAEIDAVDAFTTLVHKTLREDYAFLSKEEMYPTQELSDALLGVYIYDMDTDGKEEMLVVRTSQDGVFADMYEFRDNKAKYAASQKLELDPMNETPLMLTDPGMRHIEARLTIYPKGADRYLCLTAEQQAMDGEYNAYTIVLEYAKEKVTVKKSYRLRQSGDAVTLMCTDNVTLLFRQAAGQAPATETDVKLAKYSDLSAAFKAEFDKLGLNVPQASVENGSLTQYKVTPVASEQHVFDVTVDAGTAHMAENGFLQSFILRK
ncbi:MAG: hypothetical protein IJT44_04095 [Clostridia bacterium]|nr:hypothetical protein [Clostridia bacterium]